MTKYNYHIRYDNSDETELGGCQERLDLDSIAKREFVTIVFDPPSSGQRRQRFLINMAHVTHIREITIEDEEGGSL